jgi:transcription elongation GreA/GreB family factor
MNSTFTFCNLDTCEMETYTLDYPDRGDIANRKLSVFAPIGTAVLGYRVGDELQWAVTPAEGRTGSISTRTRGSVPFVIVVRE